jgi:6,7-dimethyl-8-ribityllumazine synthase
MAGKSPKLKTLNASKLKVAVVSASWHPEICSSLIDGAKRALAVNKVNKVSYHEVSGSFELPLAAQKLFDSGIDAVVVLGLILKGDTPHFDYICEGVTNGIMQVSLSRSKPIGFGVLMCNTLKQARDRAGFVDSNEDKGFDAAVAAINSALNY